MALVGHGNGWIRGRGAPMTALDRYGGLIWLAVFAATYGGIYVLVARDARRYRERALREWYAGEVADGD